MAGHDATSQEPAPRWLDDDEQLAWRSILEFTVDLMRRLDDDLAEHDLSKDDYEVLARLSESPDGALRMTDLAEQSSMAPSRLTYRIARLEARGIIERRSCPTDGRGTLASLTPEGVALLATVAPHHVEGVRRYLIDSLGRDRFLNFGDAARHVVDSSSRAVRPRVRSVRNAAEPPEFPPAQP